jgi:hypothetical protein
VADIYLDLDNCGIIIDMQHELLIAVLAGLGGMLGLAVMFIGDAGFSYTTTVGTFYNANWSDLILTTGTFLLTFGVLGFYTLKE